MPNPTAVEPASVAIDGKKVRQQRKQRGDTIVSLAAKSGISYGYLSQIERGTRPNVGPPVFVRICDALGVAEENRDRLIRRDAR